MADEIRIDYDFNVVPTLRQFMNDKSFITAVMGPFGCVAGDTLIITEKGVLPISEITEPMRVLSWNEQTNQFELALSGSAFPKGRDYLYRISMPQGEFVAAGHHRVFSADHKYLRVDELKEGDVLAECSFNPTSISVSEVPLAYHSNDPHLMKRLVDSMGDYAKSARQYGQQFLMEEGSDPVSFLQPADAHRSTSLFDTSYFGHMDVLEGLLPEHNHLNQYVFQKQTESCLYPPVPHYSTYADCVSEQSFGHTLEIALQYKLSQLKSFYHRTKKLLLSYFHSYSFPISDRSIISIERLPVKQAYWDLQVLDTNNYVTADGTVHHNSGKSSACVMKLLNVAFNQAPDTQGVRRTKFCVIRNSYVQLKDTTKKTIQRWLPFATWKEYEHTFYIDINLPDGTSVKSEWLLRALDRPDQIGNLKSLELTYAWLNEASEIPKEIFDTIQGRIDRFPEKVFAPAVGSMADFKEEIMVYGPTEVGLMMDTNPPDTESWFYKFFEETRPENARLFKQPSGLSEEAENLKYVGTDYYKRMAIGKDEEFIKVYIHGEYGFVKTGLPVFANFRDSKHVWKEDLKPIQGLPLVIGLDLGRTPACIVCQLDARGRVHVLDELTSEYMDIREFTQSLLKPLLRSKYINYEYVIVSDPSGVRKSEIDSRTVFQELKYQGLKAKPAKTNSIQSRLAAVNSFLTRIIEDKPAFILSPNCKVLRQAMNGKYCYRKMITSDERYTDVPDKNEFSHICFVANTKVGTPNGESLIQDLKVGDLVSTPLGDKPILAVGHRPSSSLYEVELSNGKRLIATEDHPFFTPEGLVSTSTLQYGTVLIGTNTKEELKWKKVENQKILTKNLMGSGTTKNLPDTSVLNPELAPDTYILQCGSREMGQSQKDFVYTIKTMINQITSTRIWNSCQNQTMQFTISPNGLLLIQNISKTVYATQDPTLISGMALMKEGCGIASMEKKVGLTDLLKTEFVFVVKKLTKLLKESIKKDFAPQLVSQKVGEILEWIISKEFVPSALKNFLLTNILKLKPVVTVVSVKPLAEPNEVYNITVDEVHAYFAEGVLVSNCDALQYACMEMETGFNWHTNRPIVNKYDSMQVEIPTAAWT